MNSIAEIRSTIKLRTWLSARCENRNLVLLDTPPLGVKCGYQCYLVFVGRAGLLRSPGNQIIRQWININETFHSSWNNIYTASLSCNTKIKMSDTNTNALIITAALLVFFGLAFFLLRGKIKNAKLKAGGVSAEIGTHEPDRLVVKSIEQIAEKGGNAVTLRSTNTTVDGLKQTAQKDNVLNIGN